jgi:hypothetical protein
LPRQARDRQTQAEKAQKNEWFWVRFEKSAGTDCSHYNISLTLRASLDGPLL